MGFASSRGTAQATAHISGAAQCPPLPPIVSRFQHENRWALEYLNAPANPTGAHCPRHACRQRRLRPTPPGTQTRRTWANYLLRSLPPATTAAYASPSAAASQRSWALRTHRCPPNQHEQHDSRCGLADSVCEGSLVWTHYGHAPIHQARVPSAAERLLAALRDDRAARLPSLLALTQAAACLTTQGYAVPAWDEALSDLPGLHSRHDEPADFLRGGQRRASHACNERALETHLADLSPASRALLLSQAGPHAARAFTVLPPSDDVAIPDSHFRVLLLRRLRMPLPLGPRSCSCRGALDAYGDHRAACSTSSVLASRALPLERAIARVCQEAGARVGRNVALAAMNIDVPVHDARRIEVVCNGPPLWHGAQLAVDATLVSPVAGKNKPRNSPTHRAGAALDLVYRHPRAYIQVHNSEDCRCNDVLCCPFLGSDHFAISIVPSKVSVALPTKVPALSFCVRDWRRLLISQRQAIHDWSSRVRSLTHACQQSTLVTPVARQNLDTLYHELLTILWGFS